MRYPIRIIGFALVLIADPKAAAVELDYYITELGFVGTLILNYAKGTYYNSDEYLLF